MVAQPWAFWMGDTLVRQWEIRLVLKTASCCFVPNPVPAPRRNISFLLDVLSQVGNYKISICLWINFWHTQHSVSLMVLYIRPSRPCQLLCSFLLRCSHQHPGEVPFVSSSLQKTGVVVTWNVEEENLSMNFHDFKICKANADVRRGTCLSTIEHSEAN